MNTNISSLQTLVTAMQNNDYVTGVTPITKNGENIGYTITFTKSNPITIYHGEDGRNGENGSNGNDGQNGITPVIGVKQDTDGLYYWTLNGDWLCDANGTKIKAQGTDGKNGDTGDTGEDGITPKLKIEDGYWLVSYDNGVSWTTLGKAIDDSNVNDANGDLFQSVNTSNSDYVIFTLADDTQIKLPTWSAFEALRTMCNQMNTNIQSLRDLINVLESRDYIRSVSPLMEDGVQVGYTITFAMSNPITIYTSTNVAPTTPVIGVKKHSDGVYYWTIDGEWLLDDSGNKVKAEGKDGSNGSNGTSGTNGKNGVTPKLKIEDGYWYVSYDNEVSWSKLGKATGTDGIDGEDGDNIFSSVSQDEEYVYFNLSDGTVITLQKQDRENIQFEDLQVKAICCKNWDTNEDGELSYTEAAAVTSIDDVFYNTKIIAFKEFKYFTGITTLSCKAFSNCTSLWEIELPANIVTIEDGGFYDGKACGTFCNTAITNISLPNAVTTIGKYAFQDCIYLKNIKLGNNITTIGIEAFRNCKCMSNLILPNSLTHIGRSAFWDCDSLTSVTIPKNVTIIDNNTFWSCDNLTTAYIKAITPPVVSGNETMSVFGYPSNCVVIIYVPTDSVNKYKTTSKWKEYDNRIFGYNFE